MRNREEIYPEHTPESILFNGKMTSTKTIGEQLGFTFYEGLKVDGEVSLDPSDTNMLGCVKPLVQAYERKKIQDFIANKLEIRKTAHLGYALYLRSNVEFRRPIQPDKAVGFFYSGIIENPREDDENYYLRTTQQGKTSQFLMTNAQKTGGVGRFMAHLPKPYEAFGSLLACNFECQNISSMPHSKRSGITPSICVSGKDFLPDDKPRILGISYGEDYVLLCAKQNIIFALVDQYGEVVEKNGLSICKEAKIRLVKAALDINDVTTLAAALATCPSEIQYYLTSKEFHKLICLRAHILDLEAGQIDKTAGTSLITQNFYNAAKSSPDTALKNLETFPDRRSESECYTAFQCQCYDALTKLNVPLAPEDMLAVTTPKALNAFANTMVKNRNVIEPIATALGLKIAKPAEWHGASFGFSFASQKKQTVETVLASLKNAKTVDTGIRRAAAFNKVESLRFLLENASDYCLNSKSSQGLTALDYAKGKGNAECVSLLTEYMKPTSTPCF